MPLGAFVYLFLIDGMNRCSTFLFRVESTLLQQRFTQVFEWGEKKILIFNGKGGHLLIRVTPFRVTRGHA